MTKSKQKRKKLYFKLRKQRRFKRKKLSGKKEQAQASQTVGTEAPSQEAQ